MPEAGALTKPLREGIRLRRTPDPCAMVIFGASGDLTKRKLMPALYCLAREGMLAPGALAVVARMTAA
jgi:glucose-6-phosphate 1-dehydrogenase